MASLIGDLGSRLFQSASGVADDTVTLKVNGYLFEGWTEVSIKRSVKAISGSFELSLMDKWAQQAVQWTINPGDECRVNIGAETLVTGYVDSLDSRIEAANRSISVSGRDKSGDLVDSSITQSGVSGWFNISLKNLAERLVKSFGIGVVIDLSAAEIAAKSISNWRLQQGEAVFESLDRCAKLVGVLITSDGRGNIVLTRAGSSRSNTTLVQGENILSCDSSYSFRERFSEYIVKAYSKDLDAADPEQIPIPQAKVSDLEIRRRRPLIIVAEGLASPAICRARAQWECSTRIGKGLRVNVVVQGWRQGDGELWKCNLLCTLTAPSLAIDSDPVSSSTELLITEVTFRKNDRGTTTELTLEPARAYLPDPTLLYQKSALAMAVAQESIR